MLIQQDHTTVDEFFGALNRTRLAHPQKWIFFDGMVAGKHVELKTFGASYLQIYRIDGISQVMPGMDCKVSLWKSAILAPFQGVAV